MTRRRHSRAPLPVMPTDPWRCRWCGGRRLDVLGTLICPAGCADNDKAPYLGHCRECERDFDTGLRLPDVCHECYESDMKAMGASYRTIHETRDYQRKEHERRLAEKDR